MFEPNTKMNINVITGIKDRRVVVIDNFYFGVASVGKNGHESVIVFPNQILRN